MGDDLAAKLDRIEEHAREAAGLRVRVDLHERTLTDHESRIRENERTITGAAWLRNYGEKAIWSILAALAMYLATRNGVGLP